MGGVGKSELQINFLVYLQQQADAGLPEPTLPPGGGARYRHQVRTQPHEVNFNNLSFFFSY